MFRVALSFHFVAIAVAVYGKNPGYVDLDSVVCQPYGSTAILESDDCKTALNCKTWGKPKLLNCVRGTKRVLQGSSCVYTGFLKSNRCDGLVRERRKLCSQTNVRYLADSNFCHLYYDCYDPTDSRICPYPRLFSESTKSCENYKNVRCGKRLELKSYCHYNPKSCSPYCSSCEIHHPSCEGYSDGVHPHSQKTGAGSPWYMICRGERFVKEGICPNARYGFNPKTCKVVLNDVRSCGKNVDKLYPSSRCDKYIWCHDGRMSTMSCPAGTVFDAKRQYCNHPYITCKPCGRLSC